MNISAQSIGEGVGTWRTIVSSGRRWLLFLVVALLPFATPAGVIGEEKPASKGGTPPAGAVAEEKEISFEVTLGERASPTVLPGAVVDIAAIVGPGASLRGAQFFELSPYRTAKVKWSDDLRVEVHLYAEMSLRKVRQRAERDAAIRASGGDPAETKFFIADCGLLPATDESWVFDPGDLVCEGDFVDGSAVIEVRVKANDPAEDRALYFRAKNRRFPFVGSDLGIALTLTEPLNAEGDLDKGFEINDGLSLYYSISRLKSDRWRAIASLAALDHVKAAAGETEDPEDLEIGLGLGMMFKSNGFLDTNTGMSLAAGIGYNFMVPEPGDRWYWFFGVGANFGRTVAKSD